MRSIRLPLVASIFAMYCGGASAEDAIDIGSAVTIVNSVTAELNNGERALATGDDVLQNELISVAPNARGELKFRDETKVALGPGSKLVLDKFVYDPGRNTGSIVMDFAKGALRFMTGVAQKPSYTIKTPVASITVRGTIFDLFVQNDGTTWLLLHEGAVEITSDGKCKVHNQPGRVVRITASRALGIPVKWSGLPGSNAVPFDNAFPFVVNAPTIDPNPVFNRDAIVNGQVPGPDAGIDDERCANAAGAPDDDPPSNPRQFERQPKKKDRVRETYRSKPDVVVRERPKKTTKRRDDTDEKVARGIGLAIGIGIAIGSSRGRGGHKGDYPGRGMGNRTSPPLEAR